MSTSEHASPLQWWLPQALELEQCWQVAIGPLTLYLKRNLQEWLFSFERDNESELQCRLESNGAVCLPELLATQRFMFRHSPTTFQLKPKLLDRSVVIKTRQRVSIPPGENSVFYISSPVVIDITVQQPELSLLQIPVQRLSDTWFGPPTHQGELCYADKTQARHCLEEVPPRPHRAITAVTIENRSTAILTLDKLSIPLPYLALYGHQDGSLWTDPIVLRHENLQSLSHFQLGKTLPVGLTSQQQLAPAQFKTDPRGLVRAFTDIFQH
jgi:hypothetical protein